MFVTSIYSSKWDWKNPFVENEQEKVGTTIFPQQVYWDQFHLQFLFPNHPERGNKVNLHFFRQPTSSGLCWVFNAATAVKARNVLGSKTQSSVLVLHVLFIEVFQGTSSSYYSIVCTSESQSRDRMPVQLDPCSTQSLPHIPSKQWYDGAISRGWTNHVL